MASSTTSGDRCGLFSIILPSFTMTEYFFFKYTWLEVSTKQFVLTYVVVLLIPLCCIK